MRAPSEPSPARSQPWHMVSLCHAGAFALMARGRARVLDSSCAFLANPGETYRTSLATSSGSWGSSVAVRADVLAGLAQELPTPALQPPLRFAVPWLPCRTRACVIGRIVYRAALEGDRDVLAIQEAGISLVAELVAADAGTRAEAGGREGGRSARCRDTLDAVRALLAERLEEPLELEVIARTVGVSPYHLCRVFRARAGETLHRYRNRLRLRAALQPVLDGADLTAVALASGYSSHSHFTAAFKREFGVTPSRFRQLAKGPTLRALLEAAESFPRQALPLERAIP
jgi:AraC family transcriptional regulator